MNLYFLWVDQNGYDEYDSMVISAPNEESAMNFYPTVSCITLHGAWKLENVHIKLIGTAIEGTEQQMICGSFNGG
jgi:hypothetical protein